MTDLAVGRNIALKIELCGDRRVSGFVTSGKIVVHALCNYHFQRSEQVWVTGQQKNRDWNHRRSKKRVSLEMEEDREADGWEKIDRGSVSRGGGDSGGCLKGRDGN